MEELLGQALKGLIAAGPLALFLGLALKWVITKLEQKEAECKGLSDQVKQKDLELAAANTKIADAKDQCRIEILSVQNEGNKAQIVLFERVMKVLEHVGGKEP